MNIVKGIYKTIIKDLGVFIYGWLSGLICTVLLIILFVLHKEGGYP